MSVSGGNKELPVYRIAYLRLLYGFEKGIYNEAITEAFQRVTGWAKQQQLLTPSTEVIGLTYDHPDITDAYLCRYDAGLTVDSIVNQVQHEINVQTIAAGRM